MRNYKRITKELAETGIVVRNGAFCADALVDDLLGLEFSEELDSALESGEDVGLSKKPGAIRVVSGPYIQPMDAYKLVQVLNEIVERELG